jgi:hypothetical protein
MSCRKVGTIIGLMKIERQDETQFITKIGGKTSLGVSHLVKYVVQEGRYNNRFNEN